MPPSRRRLPSAPPSGRRPRVAGLHRPGTSRPAPEHREAEQPRLTPRRRQDAERPESGRDRDTGAAATEATKAADHQTSGAELVEPLFEPPVPWWRRRPRGRYALVAVLLVLALAFSGLAVLFKVRHSEAVAATGNAALVDVATTAQVKEAMSAAAEKLFSVDYNDLGKNQQAADELLVGKEVKQKYDAVMGQVRELAPKQKMVVTVEATRSAVVSLKGDRARVMVYLDQTATRVDNPPAAGGAAMWFTAQRHDGQWKVVAMDTYNVGQSAPPAPASEQDKSQAGN